MLMLAIPGVLIGIYMLWSVLNYHPCSEWSRLGSASVLVVGVIVQLPVGLLVLAIGGLRKNGDPRLRRLCIDASVVILSLPILSFLISLVWHCP
jgi:hypothetical protein